MKNLKNLKKNRNNKGFSFVMVIVSIGVVAILIAVVLLLAYQNYKMKVTGLRSEDNFYSAEQVLDEIKAGLQGDMSSSVSDAYSYVMEHYTDTDGQDGVRNWYFQTQYVDDLYDTLLKEGSSGEYDLAYISQYVLQGSPGEAAAAAAPADGESVSPGCLVEYADGSKVELLCSVSGAAVIDDEGSLVSGEKPLEYSYNKGVTINGLTVKYTNAQGYLSVISTDLVLGIPAINFTQTATSPDLLSYALIADTGLEVSGNLGGRSTIDGNAYAGVLNIDNANLTIKADDYLIVKDGINVKASSTNNEELAKENYHFVHEGGALWTDGITLDGATLSMDGDIYVRDDLTLNGKESIAAVAGKYLGYSNPQLLNDFTNEADTSSAIIVNGRKSVLDLKNLDALLLAGNGYVDIGGSASEYFSNAGSGTVRMGESIAIKSNQLAYLAPADAIRISNGVIAQSGNPLGVKVKAGYELSDLSIYLNTQITLPELGGKSLRDLGIDADDCQPYVVQGAASDGTLTIYVYMNLDAEKASKYFDARYGSDTEKYAKIYLPAVADADKFEDVFDKSMSSMDRLDLNGNIANVASHNLKESDVQQEILGYQNAFKALTRKLILNYSVLSRTEETGTLYTNLINETELKNFLASRPGKKAVFRTPVTEMDAILIDNEGGSAYCPSEDVAEENDNIRLIIATGDVHVKEDFQGLIIAKGEVKINGVNAKITAVPEEAAAVFQCIYSTGFNADGTRTQMEDNNGKVVSPMSYFNEGEQYLLNGIASGYVSGTLGDQINLADFIQFENWQKQ